jgi:hypothetical protein
MSGSLDAVTLTARSGDASRNSWTASSTDARMSVASNR